MKRKFKYLEAALYLIAERCEIKTVKQDFIRMFRFFGSIYAINQNKQKISMAGQFMIYTKSEAKMGVTK